MTKRCLYRITVNNQKRIHTYPVQIHINYLRRINRNHSNNTPTAKNIVPDTRQKYSKNVTTNIISNLFYYLSPSTEAPRINNVAELTHTTLLMNSTLAPPSP